MSDTAGIRMDNCLFGIPCLFSCTKICLWHLKGFNGWKCTCFYTRGIDIPIYTQNLHCQTLYPFHTLYPRVNSQFQRPGCLLQHTLSCHARMTLAGSAQDWFRLECWNWSTQDSSTLNCTELCMMNCWGQCSLHFISYFKSITQHWTFHYYVYSHFVVFVYCTIHTIHRILHAEHIAHYTPHTAHRTHCTLHNTYCTLHTAYCTHNTLHTKEHILHT